jgi:subtilase family serine protease
MTKRLRTALPAVLICVILLPANLQAEHPLTEQYRSRSSLKGRVNPNYQIRSMMFAFGLQNRPELERLLQDQQDPDSVNYHRWLTPAEFGARFGVSPKCIPCTGLGGITPWRRRICRQPIIWLRSFGGGETEALLDMEWVAAVAPGATIQVVIAPNSDTQSAMDYIVNRLPATRVISISFGDGESNLPASQASQYLTSLDFYFMQAAAQGQTFLVASGDGGAQQTIGNAILSRGRDINYLCASGYVVCVGGTTLNLQFDNSGNATQYLGGTVSNALSSRGGGASGGRASRHIAKPSYQTGPGVPADGARDVPDVAAVADPGGPGALIVQNGTISNQTYVGTSLSTPIWAGLFALVNRFGSPGGVGLCSTHGPKLT